MLFLFGGRLNVQPFSLLEPVRSRLIDLSGVDDDEQHDENIIEDFVNHYDAGVYQDLAGKQKCFEENKRESSGILHYKKSPTSFEVC